MLSTDTVPTLLIAPYGQKQGKANQPNPTQKRILNWVDKIRALPSQDKDHIPVLYLQGGVGCGKTRGVMAPVIEILTQVLGLFVLWVRQDYKDLKLSVMPKFFEVLPPEFIVRKNEQMGWHEIAQVTGNGTSRIFWNGAKDIGGLGSQEFGVVAVTEVHQLTYQSYMALKRRCRQAGVVNFILMESEPPNDDHWLSKITDRQCEEYDPDVEKWEISTYENWDNLPTSYRGSLERMPESWKKKYLFGRTGFIPDGKPFYTGFKERIHKRELHYLKGKTIFRGWDFGWHHPVCTITQIDALGRWCILREIIGTDITIDRFADIVKPICNEYYPNAKYMDYGDPAGNAKKDIKTEKGEQTSFEVLLSKGIEIQAKQSEYRGRKEIIEKKLSTLISGIPALIVDSSCTTIIDAFLGGYHYPKSKEGKAIGEVPVHDDYYSHVMNSIEYIAVNLFAPFQPKEKEYKDKYAHIKGDY